MDFDEKDIATDALVLNPKTFKEITKISTTALLGEAEGVNPRHMTAHGSKVYVSTYGGYVAEIDTVAFNMTRSFKVGSFSSFPWYEVLIMPEE